MRGPPPFWPGTGRINWTFYIGACWECFQRIPGVQGVAAPTYAPMSGDSWNEGIRVQESLIDFGQRPPGLIQGALVGIRRLRQVLWTA